MKSRKYFLILAALVVTPMFALADGSVQLASFKKAIHAKYDLKVKGFEFNDANLIVEEFYTEDAITVDPEGKTYQGRAELLAMYKETVKIGTVRIEPVNTKVSGNMGWDWANFYLMPNDPVEAPIAVKILFLWEKVNGEWRCAGDMVAIGEFELVE